MEVYEYEKYGGMSYPSYQHSFTALIIVFWGYFIKNEKLKFITYINGLSSFIAHNPFVANKLPYLQEKSQYIDKNSIFTTFYLLPLLLKNPEPHIFMFYYLIHSIIKTLINTDEQKYVFGIIYSIYKIYKNKKFTKKLIFFICLSALLKITEKKSIYIHSLWHISSGITNMLICNSVDI
jgi:hypothetical protein